MSKDPEKVSAFYEKIFGWKIQHMPGLDYRMVETGGEGGINGGIVKPERKGPWPGNMLFYIDVDDLAVIARRSSRRAAKSTSRSRRCPAWARFRFSWIPMRKTYHGSWHCGAVRFEADIDLFVANY